MTTTGTTVSNVFDAEAVLADPAALAALRRLAARLRAISYANAPDPVAAGLTRLALGHPVDRAGLEGWLTDSDVDALARAGAVDVDQASGTVSPRSAVLAMGRLLVLVPCDRGDAPERVYVGRDSLWMAEVAAAHAPPGDSAADLGAGTGLLSVVLATRYRRVLATDVLPRTVAAAVLTAALNQRADRPAAVFGVVADVARGLQPESFDLVTANPPWVPDPSGASGRTYNDGGPTGFELPLRFLREGAALLRAGGVMVMLGADVCWPGGRAPLREALCALEATGVYRAELIATPMGVAWDQIPAAFTFGDAGAPLEARHVAVVLRRR